MWFLLMFCVSCPGLRAFGVLHTCGCILYCVLWWVCNERMCSWYISTPKTELHLHFEVLWAAFFPTEYYAGVELSAKDLEKQPLFFDVLMSNFHRKNKAGELFHTQGHTTLTDRLHSGLPLSIRIIRRTLATGSTLHASCSDLLLLFRISGRSCSRFRQDVSVSGILFSKKWRSGAEWLGSLAEKRKERHFSSFFWCSRHVVVWRGFGFWTQGKHCWHVFYKPKKICYKSYVEKIRL